MSPRLAFALDTAFLAGRLTLRHFQTNSPIELKPDVTPVTEADREAEKLIRASIEKKYPGETVLGEEQGLQGASDDRWVVDPIDGTKSFICGVPLYATLLSYEMDGEPEIGVCYFPALDEMLYAQKGEGAFWNGRAAQVSDQSEFKNSRVSCGSISTLQKQDRLSKMLTLAGESLVIRTWCDAYGHALVATGRIDVMLDPVVKRWDISALSLIVREAGGRFTDFQGGEQLADEVISSNGYLHPAALEAFRA